MTAEIGSIYYNSLFPDYELLELNPIEGYKIEEFKLEEGMFDEGLIDYFASENKSPLFNIDIESDFFNPQWQWSEGKNKNIKDNKFHICTFESQTSVLDKDCCSWKNYLPNARFISNNVIFQEYLQLNHKKFKISSSSFEVKLVSGIIVTFLNKNFYEINLLITMNNSMWAVLNTKMQRFGTYFLTRT
jgi:hypothetical protein